MSVYLCLFFLLAGSGVSYMHYCCQECAKQGIAHVVNGTCDRVHHSKHHHDTTCHHHGSCHYLHYAVENTTIDNSQDYSTIDSTAVIAYVFELYNKLNLSSISSSLLSWSKSDCPPPLSGADIVIAKRYLVI